MSIIDDLKTHPKAYFSTDNGVLLCGDCLEIMQDMPDKCVDLVLTDPPYGMNFQSNHRVVKHDKIEGDKKYPIAAVTQSMRIAVNAVYTFCRWDNIYDLPKPKSILVWVKNNWSMGDLKHEHGRKWEACLFYCLEGHKFNKRIPDVIKAMRTGNNYHPTEKPVGLLKNILECNVGELVFDPFLGSGTTAVACEKLGRKWIGIEISEKYCEIAAKRIKAENNQIKLFV